MNAVVLVCLVGGLGIVVWAILGPLSHASKMLLSVLGRIAVALEANTIDSGLKLERRLSGLEEGLEKLPTKWDDIRREARGFYERARHHIRRVDSELQDRGLQDPELDHLDRELHLVDGGGSDPEGLSPVPAGVADGAAPGQAAPDDYMTLGLRRKFGGDA